MIHMVSVLMSVCDCVSPHISSFLIRVFTGYSALGLRLNDFILTVKKNLSTILGVESQHTKLKAEQGWW